MLQVHNNIISNNIKSNIIISKNPVRNNIKSNTVPLKLNALCISYTI